jgi:hypothetical protein
VNDEALEQLYSSKAEIASLRDEAKSVLADELRRRNLDAVPVDHERKPDRDGTSLSKSRFIRVIRFGGILILNICVALLATAALETEIGGIFHPHSIAGVLWKFWSLDLLSPAIVGFFMWRTWKTEATKWAWALPAFWFGLRFIVALSSRGNQSVLWNESVWSHFSGADCANGVPSSGCTNFFVFTVPFVRGVSYSIGAYFSSMVSHRTPQSTVDVDSSSPRGCDS